MGAAPWHGLHSFSLRALSSRLELAGAFLSTEGKGDHYLSLAKEHWDAFRVTGTNDVFQTSGKCSKCQKGL